MKCGKVERVVLKNYTTYKVGGKTTLATPRNIDDLKKLITFLRDNNIKYKILGNGSNVIFNNSGYDGVVIKLSEFNDLKITGNTVIVGAGYNLMKLAIKTCHMGLFGLDFADKDTPFN